MKVVQAAAVGRADTDEELEALAGRALARLELRIDEHLAQSGEVLVSSSPVAASVASSEHRTRVLVWRELQTTPAANPPAQGAARQG